MDDWLIEFQNWTIEEEKYQAYAQKILSDYLLELPNEILRKIRVFAW